MTRFLAALLFIGLVLAAGSPRASAQISDFKIGIGLSAAWINGDNPARDFLFPDVLQGSPTDSIVYLPGGSLDGLQPGIGLHARFALGDSSMFRLMLGVDYLFYRGTWRIPLETGAVYLEHKVDMPTGVIGGEFVVRRLTPFVNLYSAVELRASYLHSGFFNWEFKDLDGSLIQSREATTAKASAFRMGAALRVGLEGEFESNIFVDTSIGYGAVNLLGRDDVRGQLLTSNPSQFETEESVVGNILFSLMLMYRI